MIFRMDTDAVRAMAARFCRTASTMETSLASIRQSVRSAPWQSQAREEFIQQLEMLHNSTLRSAEVLRMMALAAEQKANQWEAIGDRFNGPWQPMGNAWGQLKNMMGWLWSRIRNAVRGIKWPSVPKYVVPATTGGAVLGALITKPPWLTWPPKWWPPWPFNKIRSDTHFSGGGGGGSGGGSWGGPDENSGESNKLSGKEDTSPPSPVSDIKTTHDIKYDGSKPAPGMDSTYGKPGQHPLSAPVTSNHTNRSAELYEDVINQFGVGNNPRYTRDVNTYCNTFAGDVARAMDVPFPKKSEWGINPKDPATIGFPDLYRYFTDSKAPMTASNDGWRQIGTDNLSTLQSHVNSGKMAVVITEGHIAVVRPDQIITDFSSIELAQAGATNSNLITVGEAFSTPIKKGEQPLIYIID